MTTEEKANEICKRHIFDSNHYDCCMEMAEWKDSQLKHYLETCLEKAQKRAVDKLVITLESMIEELGL